MATRTSTTSNTFTSPPPGRLVEPGSFRLAQKSSAREETSVGHHAVVGPHRLALDVPGPVEHLDGVDHAEPAAQELVAQLRHLRDLGGVGDQHAAPVHGAG